MNDYFDGVMTERQALLWSNATQVQIDRWDPLVAQWIGLCLGEAPDNGSLVWAAQTEHHLLLIAARNMIAACDLRQRPSIDSVARKELIESRDLHEHWVDNLPIFSVTPRRVQPRRRSGREFAERNPDATPYDWLRWTNRDGSLITPNVPTFTLRELVASVREDVLAVRPELARFAVEPAPIPWMSDEHGWWPASRPR